MRSFETIGSDQNGIARVWGTAPTKEESVRQAEIEAAIYEVRRPDVKIVAFKTMHCIDGQLVD